MYIMLGMTMHVKSSRLNLTQVVSWMTEGQLYLARSEGATTMHADRYRSLTRNAAEYTKRLLSSINPL